MSSDFTIYRDAQRAIGRGWLQDDWSDADGNVCLAQGLLNGLGQIDSRVLPDSVVDEMHAELRKHRSYRVILAAIRIKRAVEAGIDGKIYATIYEMRPEQSAMIAWNDAPWRKQEHVMAALESVGDASELKRRTNEMARLIIEVELLKHRIAECYAQITKLKAENTSLRKRLTNRVALRESRTNLQSLSDELERTWSELTAAKA